MGNGIRDARLEWVLESFEEEERSRIKEILSGIGENPMWGIDRKLTYCGHCRIWKVRPCFHVENEDGSETHTVYGRCEVCRQKPEFYDTDVIIQQKAKLFCPNCGKKKLSVESAGTWD